MKRNLDYILEQAKSHYPETGSHGWNHIQDVMDHARQLKGSELSPEELAALAYHDSSLMTGARETHAEDSAEIAKRELRKYFRRKKLENIVNAIARHRASYEGKRETPLEDLVAAADRNSPDAIKDILRSYAYGKEHGWSDEDAIANTLEHIPAKYGRNGYAYKNVPEIYMKAHKDELENAYSMLDNLTADKIREIVSKQASDNTDDKKRKRKIKSPEELEALYKKLKYRVLHQETGRPFFNTNFETFKNWHLLSPEQIKKHKIGICYDTAAMTDKVLKDLGIEHKNYFMHTDSPTWEEDPTHTFNIYKDTDGNWRWLEGSWGQYKNNKLKKERAEDLVREIVGLHRKQSGKDKILLHEVGKFPEAGIGMQDFYSEMTDWPQKTAQVYDKKKWPDYDEYQKKRHDKAIELVRKLVKEHYDKQHAWGAKTESGKFLEHNDINNKTINDVIVRGGDSILRQRRGMCHELANARLKMLKDHGIDARRLFAFYGVGQDNDGLLGHSFVFFKGDDGKLHFASPGMQDRPRKNFGVFDDLDDAVTQYIAAIKSRGDGGFTDDDFVEIHDTTDMDIPDKIKFRDFLHKALKGKLLYSQGR